jgi:hypothetical protein
MRRGLLVLALGNSGATQVTAQVTEFASVLGNAPEGLRRACGHCGRPLPVLKTGTIRRNGRFCSSVCKAGNLRAARQRAQQDLQAGLHQLHLAKERIEMALTGAGGQPGWVSPHCEPMTSSPTHSTPTASWS